MNYIYIYIIYIKSIIHHVFKDCEEIFDSYQEYAFNVRWEVKLNLKHKISIIGQIKNRFFKFYNS